MLSHRKRDSARRRCAGRGGVAEPLDAGGRSGARHRQRARHHAVGGVRREGGKLLVQRLAVEPSTSSKRDITRLGESAVEGRDL